MKGQKNSSFLSGPRGAWVGLGSGEQQKDRKHDNECREAGVEQYVDDCEGVLQERGAQRRGGGELFEFDEGAPGVVLLVAEGCDEVARELPVASVHGLEPSEVEAFVQGAVVDCDGDDFMMVQPCENVLLLGGGRGLDKFSPPSGVVEDRVNAKPELEPLGFVEFAVEDEVEGGFAGGRAPLGEDGQGGHCCGEERRDKS